MITANQTKEEMTYVSDSVDEIVNQVRESLLMNCYRVWVSHNYINPEKGKFKLETAREINATN
jgi:hypothetical protein